MSSLRKFIVVGLAFALLLAFPLVAPAAESPEAARRQEIETVVQEYLRAHPEVVAEALQEMERREQEAQRKRAAEAVRAHLAELTQDPGSPVGGNPQGAVTIVEFFDYQCGYCKGEVVELKKLLQADPDIRLVYKDLPILGPVSTFAARAALAAQQQGKQQGGQARFASPPGREPARPRTGSGGLRSGGRREAAGEGGATIPNIGPLAPPHPRRFAAWPLPSGARKGEAAPQTCGRNTPGFLAPLGERGGGQVT